MIKYTNMYLAERVAWFLEENIRRYLNTVLYGITEHAWNLVAISQLDM